VEEDIEWHDSERADVNRPHLSSVWFVLTVTSIQFTASSSRSQITQHLELVRRIVCL